VGIPDGINSAADLLPTAATIAQASSEIVHFFVGYHGEDSGINSVMQTWIMKIGVPMGEAVPFKLAVALQLPEKKKQNVRIQNSLLLEFEIRNRLLERLQVYHVRYNLTRNDRVVAKRG
jgi:hypothetical protein